jgi:hypothetical protein
MSHLSEKVKILIGVSTYASTFSGGFEVRSAESPGLLLADGPAKHLPASVPRRFLDFLLCQMKK